MAMIGEQFLVGDEICGIVLSLRNPWDQVNHNRHSIQIIIVILDLNLASQLGR